MKIDTNGKQPTEKENLIMILETAISMCKSNDWKLKGSSFTINNNIEERFENMGALATRPTLKGKSMDIHIDWEVK